MRHYIISLIMSCLWIGLCSGAQAQIVETDFDQDGLSDLTLVQPESGGALNWLSVNSSNGLTTTLGQLGKMGNHLILARWLGNSSPEIGVVYYSPSTKSIVWEVLDEGGISRTRQFGEKGDLVISGADFDGSGVADAAVARISGGKVKWYVASDPFKKSSEQAGFVQVGFGSNGARLFFVSPDGVQDWMGYTNGKGGRTVMRLRNFLTGEVRNSARFPRFISKEPRPRGFAVRSSNGTDMLGFARTRGKKTRLDFYGLDGVAISSVTVPGTGDVIVGDFNESSGEEVGVKASNQLVVFSPSSGVTSFLAAQSGIAVDNINVNAVGADTTPSTPSNPGNGSGNPSGPVSACSSVRSWPSSHIYKTIGSEHFSDIRRNTVGIVIKPGGSGPFPSCIGLQDSKGQVHARLGLYARGDGWEARYYAGIGCGASTPLNGSAVASRARQNTGSSNVYANFGSVCYGPIDANRCIGSSQC